MRNYERNDQLWIGIVTNLVHGGYIHNHVSYQTVENRKSTAMTILSMLCYDLQTNEVRI